MCRCIESKQSIQLMQSRSIKSETNVQDSHGHTELVKCTADQ